MSDRLPEAATPTTRLAFVAAFLIVFVLGLFVWPRLSPPDITQPIQFNHRAHADYEIECVDCHTEVLTALDPGLPANSVCADCHEEALGESEEEQVLIGWLERGEQIPWRPLFREPSHVFFSHQRHAGVAELNCTNCHGDFGQREAPPTRAPHKLRMNQCLACHVESEVEDDCTSCHR